MKNKLYRVDSLSYKDESLCVNLDQLVEMQPDGLVGAGWGVDDRSSQISISVMHSVAFKVEPEILNSFRRSIVELDACLYEDTDSVYIKEQGYASEMYSRYEGEYSLRHFVIYAENLVVHAISPIVPIVSEGRCA